MIEESYAVNVNENVLSNGKRVWIAWTNRPILNDQGEIVEILCIGNDITERIKLNYLYTLYTISSFY
jgi:PAS domain S-box-containing protein